MKFKLKPKELKTIIIGIFLTLFIMLTIYFIKNSIYENSARALMRDVIKIDYMSEQSEKDYRRDFTRKAFLARQVYSWTWWKTRKTKVGRLKLDQKFSMSLREYKKLLNDIWKYNKVLSIPVDSWQIFVPLADWMLESSLNMNVKHKTGEILGFVGYTHDGFRAAFYHYTRTLNIERGHPLYIKELFNSRLKEKDAIKLLNKSIPKMVKFDYAYKWHLLQEYDYKWDWALTAFHFGEGRTWFWRNAGLKDIPDERLDGKWEDFYMREYMETVYEIAQGISVGKPGRISKWKYKVKRLRRQRELRRKYIANLRIAIKSEEEFKRMEKRITTLVVDHKKYKKKANYMIKKQARLNDLMLDYRKSIKKRFFSWAKKKMRKIVKIKSDIRDIYDDLVEEEHNKNRTINIVIAVLICLLAVGLLIVLLYSLLLGIRQFYLKVRKKKVKE